MSESEGPTQESTSPQGRLETARRFARRRPFELILAVALLVGLLLAVRPVAPPVAEYVAWAARPSCESVGVVAHGSGARMSGFAIDPTLFDKPQGARAFEMHIEAANDPLVAGPPWTFPYTYRGIALRTLNWSWDRSQWEGWFYETKAPPEMCRWPSLEPDSDVLSRVAMEQGVGGALVVFIGLTGLVLVRRALNKPPVD